ncbi:MAG: hypothetical protein IH598_16850 [Bacteroidales bacterium]|nr:hypothetical protein [Bacteroidales bacterium]
MEKTLSLTKSLIVFIFLFITGILSAQPGPGPRQQEKIELIKTRYLTRQMQLTSAEARVFWPVYDKYQAKLDQLKKDREDWVPDSPDAFDTMNDTQIDALIDGRLAHAEAALDARKDLIKDLREILPPRKVAIFLRAEQQFAKELRDRIQEKRGQQSPPDSD